MRVKSILTAAILSCFGMTSNAEQVMDTDVVVVGAGASGSAAAYALTEQGLKVINLEKLPQTGGTGQFSEGIFAVESKIQRENNHVFTRDQAFNLVMDYSHWRPNAKLVRNYINKSADTIDWLHDLGVHFEKLTSNYPGGYYIWHIYQGRGHAVIDVLQQHFAEKGGKLLVKTAGKQLITDEKGKVVGLMAESSAGEAIRINAKTVVIATGGFGSNKEMLMWKWLVSRGKWVTALKWPGQPAQQSMAVNLSICPIVRGRQKSPPPTITRLLSNSLIYG